MKKVTITEKNLTGSTKVKVTQRVSMTEIRYGNLSKHEKSGKVKLAQHAPLC